MQDQLYDMLLQKDEITWQSIIYDLIKSEQMDPWNIDISVLSKRYVETVNQLQEMNFFISGKILLAAALLLKIKSNKLLNEDLLSFDQFLFAQEEDVIEDLHDYDPINRKDIKLPKLTIKTPQARKRKVSVTDLINALQKALAVNQRKILRKLKERSYDVPKIPEKKVDISQLIKDLYDKILVLFQKQEKVTFTELLPSTRKEDKIITILPLLHLDTQQRINLKQDEHFGEIEILKI